MNILSIDIGSRGITMAEGKSSATGIEIARVGTGYLLENTIIDSTVKNSQNLSEKISEMIQDYGFKSKTVHMTINTSRIVVREFEVPVAKLNDVEAMVNNEMRNNFGASEEDTIDFTITGQTATESGKFYQIRAVAINTEIISGYQKALSDAKLKPVVFDFHMNCIEKLIDNNPKWNELDMSGKSYIVLDIGYSGTVVYSIYDKTVVAQRYIQLGMADLASMLTSQLLLTNEQAKGEFAALLDFNDESKATTKMMVIAANFMTQMCNEIQKVIMYSVSKLPQSTISNVFLIGGGSCIPGIDSFFSKAFSLDAQVLTSLSSVYFKSKEDGKYFVRCLNAAGAIKRKK